MELDILTDLIGHKDTHRIRSYTHIGPAHLAGAISRREKSYGEVITVKKKGAAGNQ